MTIKTQLREVDEPLNGDRLLIMNEGQDQGRKTGRSGCSLCAGSYARLGVASGRAPPDEMAGGVLTR